MAIFYFIDAAMDGDRGQGDDVRRLMRVWLQ